MSHTTGTARTVTVSFDALIQKVQQAEVVLEARERETAADWRQLKATWRTAWTPGRIVIAGLVCGFLVGRTKPLRNVSGGGALQMLSALSGLLASSHAKVAADEAQDSADSLQADVASASATTTAAPDLHDPAPIPAWETRAGAGRQ